MKKVVKVKKRYLQPDVYIHLDVNKIVGISDIINDHYYIYFENAIWEVDSDSFEEVMTLWKS